MQNILDSLVSYVVVKNVHVLLTGRKMGLMQELAGCSYDCSILGRVWEGTGGVVGWAWLGSRLGWSLQDCREEKRERVAL